MTIRLMIIDDSAAIRGVYARMLDDQANIKIVASIGDPRDAIKQIATVKPDVVTLDVEMPGLTGLEALQQIRQIAPATKVVMLSTLTQRGSKTSRGGAARRVGAVAEARSRDESRGIQADLLRKAGRIGAGIVSGGNAEFQFGYVVMPTRQSSRRTARCCRRTIAYDNPPLIHPCRLRMPSIVRRS